MKTHDIIVIGTSAGGINSLKHLVSSLPRDFQGSVFIVVHIPSYTSSILPEILSNAGALTAVHPKNGDPVMPGKIYIALNDHHLLLEEDKIMVKRGPKENKFRPSIDALFRSAAFVYKERVIGVILSGFLNDGVSGLWTIQQLGGITIIQSPEDAEEPQLPKNALEEIEPDYSLNVLDIGPIISGLVKKVAHQSHKLSPEKLKLLKMEVIISIRDNAFEMGIINMGELTPFTCPECNGALVRLVEGKMLRFRCHTGHAYTASALLAELSETIESLLWQSMRGLEEMNMLLDNIAGHYKKIKNKEAAAFFSLKAKDGAKKARVIHDSVLQQTHISEDMRFKQKKNKVSGRVKKSD